MGLLGISSGILKQKSDFDLLLKFEPELIEFYNYPSNDIPIITKFCTDNGLKHNLHTPVPYDLGNKLKRFCPTGFNDYEINNAISLTLNTIRCAANTEAKYVIVHFPCPYPDSQSDINDLQIRRFFDPVMRESGNLRVKVLVENLTAHPVFNNAEHYAKLFEYYNELGLCFDIGHAWMVNGSETVEKFIEELSDYIKSVHMYSLSKLKSGSFRREFIRKPSENTNDMPLFHYIKKIKIKGVDPDMIIESNKVNPSEYPSLLKTIKWFRETVNKKDK